ncbi:anti-sigma factor [Flavobacterium sp.]|uniref:anti-sigma factor n=1 Tax=Flavobacterium sp. TaxID=239 RepID=UPI0039E3EB34
MDMKNDKLDDLFENLQGQWDIHEPDENHYDRFLEKQSRRRKGKNYWYSLSIAASILLLVGFFTFFNGNANKAPQRTDLQFASKQTRETDSIFTAMIRFELEKVKQKKSPINEKIVSDALIQMEALDKDYEKIKQELIRNGESKQIIHAMIQNLKTRIAFLEDVLEHIENTEKLSTHENTI